MENESEKARVDIIAVVIQAMPWKPENNMTTRFIQDRVGEGEAVCKKEE